MFFTSQTNLFHTHYLPRRDLTTIIRSRLSQQKASNAVSEAFNAVAREKGLYKIILIKRLKPQYLTWDNLSANAECTQLEHLHIIPGNRFIVCEMQLLRGLFALTLFTSIYFCEAWKPLLRRVGGGIVAAALAVPVLAVPVLAYDAEPSQVRAVEQILRVQNSLRYVDDSINTEGNPSAVVRQVDLLLVNYKVKDNLRVSLDLIPDKAKREEARQHGIAAIEDLQLVGGYFEDDIINTTGRKTPPQAVLKLAAQATEAASKELKQFFSLLPSDLVSEVKQKIEAEFK